MGASSNYEQGLKQTCAVPIIRHSSFPTKLDELSLAPFMATNLTEASMEIRPDINQSQPNLWVLEQGQPFGSNSGQIAPLLFEPRNASGRVFAASGDDGRFGTAGKETALHRCTSKHRLTPAGSSSLLTQIAADGLDNMAHPIHLHGHYFRVLGSMANSTFPANMTVAEVAHRMADSPWYDIAINRFPHPCATLPTFQREVGWHCDSLPIAPGYGCCTATSTHTSR